MKWLKAAIVGALAGLIMFILLAVATRSGAAPINVPPSAAFVKSMGLPPKPLAIFVHFGYAILGSIVLVALFGRRTNILRGVGLALVLWLILMLIYSPVIGWGIFGFGGPNHELPSQAPLYIRAAGPYVAGTLLLHAIYGLILGWLDSRWINFSREAESS